MKLRKGDILCVRSCHIIGRLIRWCTRGEVDHIAHYMGNKLILETRMGRGVTITRLDTLKKNRVYVARVKKSTKADVEAVDRWLRKQIGEKYDLPQIVAMLWHRIANTEHRRTLIDSSKIDVCSTLLAEAWSRRDFYFNDHIHPTNIAPHDIYVSNIVEIMGELEDYL